MSNILQAVGNSVIVKPEQQDTKTAFGVQTINDEDKKDYGLVISVGNGKYVNEVLGIKVGDRVGFGHFAGEDLEVDGEEYKILINTEDESRFDILVVLKASPLIPDSNADSQPAPATT